MSLLLPKFGCFTAGPTLSRLIQHNSEQKDETEPESHGQQAPLKKGTRYAILTPFSPLIGWSYPIHYCPISSPP